ncbi:DEAD/DEAH box helicase family protein [Streptomyces sp. NPDC006733]|uniref:DEAD/DEAH box helicase n=1 Tax=Streptomyces sp. NPDC006733 TaxID=3155460 RepID=UPI0033CF0E29
MLPHPTAEPPPHPARHQLRRHQRTARDAGYSAVRDGGRATLVSPCGTGKTLIACRIAEDLTRTRHATRVLVLVPTLDLLVQSARVWREQNQHHGTLLAVCSPRPDLDALGIPRTTDPGELAARLNDQDAYTVFATYASLRGADQPATNAEETDEDTRRKEDPGEQGTGALIAAHATGSLPPWDLIISDEAHRTSGSASKAWGAVHDDAQVPARRRLYFTATPRIWETDPAYAEGLHPTRGGPVLAASMDDEDLFGPTVYRMELSQAIAEGLVCDYRIVLVTVDHPGLQTHLRRTRSATAQDTIALTSLATALFKTAARYGTGKWVTFHHRIDDADALTRALHTAAGDLDTTTTTDGPTGTVPLIPPTFRADTVYMNHPQRVEILTNLASPAPRTDDDLPSFLTIVCNCRLLIEGWDSTSVDLCFAAPRRDVTGIVQALGRALRPRPDGSKATLLVPIYLAPGENPQDLLNHRTYQPLYDVLLALRAHDRRISDRLPTTHLGEKAPAPHPDTTPPSTAPQDPAAEQQVQPTTDRPHQAAAPSFDPAAPAPEIVTPDGVPLTATEIADVITLHVTRPPGVTADWMRGASAAADYANTHGHLAPTRTTPSTAPHLVDLPTWLDLQRTARRAGELAPWQIHYLDAYGMVWEPRQTNREQLLSYAEDYARAHGGLAVASTYQAPDGRKLGRELTNLRQRAKKQALTGATDSDPAASDDQRGFTDLLDALYQIDPWWNPPWPLPWQRHYQQALQRHRSGQPLARPGDTRTYRQWLTDPGTGLTVDQQDLLRAIAHPALVQK